MACEGHRDLGKLELSDFRVRRDPYGYNGQRNIMEKGL